MKKEVIEGKIQGNERGFGFLIATDGRAEEYFIPHSDLRGAMHGDLVLAETTVSNGGERTTARVLKIINRGISEIVGTYSSTRRGGFVTPDDDKYFCDVFIPQGKAFKARTGDKVVAKILFYPKKLNPEGIVKTVFGSSKDKNAEVKSIIYGYKLSDKFPKEVVDYAEHVVKAPTEDDLKNRKDFTNDLIITIDGEDSRDFDDAISVVKNNDGTFTLSGTYEYLYESYPFDWTYKDGNMSANFKINNKPTVYFYKE